MYNMVITDDNEQKKQYNLTAWKQTITKDSVEITLITSSKVIQYSISIDTRANDVNWIVDFLTPKIESAIQGNQTLYISEFLQRAYIFIQDEDRRKQFTAHKTEYDY